MIATISRQGGRRYPQARSCQVATALRLASVGVSAVAFTVKFRKTLSCVGGKIGSRQAQG